MAKKSKPVSKKTSKSARKTSKAKAVSKKKKKATASRKTAKVSKKKSLKAKKTAAKKTVRTKSNQPAPKIIPPQLNIFPALNQRPIAHKSKISQTEERTKYNDEELHEFEQLILGKLDKARAEYRILKETLNRENDSGTDSTSGGNTKVLEDGAETAEKENLSQLAARQQKYITNLENALIRIKNGTYGICSVTGKMIPKERLIAVPHTTQSIEAKMMKQD
jgi:RNA polymerase-binding transcription factor DksA